MSFSKYGIYYQLPVYAFADANGDGIGDFSGIVKAIPYLKSLHIDTLWLSPVHPAASYHGYDVLDYETVRPEYEVGCSFDEMISALAEQDIYVIMDMVMNHTALAHEWFREGALAFVNGQYSKYRDYYLYSWEPHGKGWYPYEIDGKTLYYYGSFDASMPDLRYREDQHFAEDPVFQYMVSVSKRWLKRGVKGFRLDGVTHFYLPQADADYKNKSFLAAYCAALREENPDVYVVAETADGDYGSGYNGSVDSILNFPLYNRIRTSLLCSSGDVVDYAMCCQQAYRRENPQAIMANFISNHDDGQGRLTMKTGNIDMIKAALAFQILLPGNPFIYYGDELAMLGERHASGGYLDTAYRTPLLWNESTPREASYLDERTRNSVWYCATPGSVAGAGGNTVEEQERDAFSVLNYTRALTEIKSSYPELFAGTVRKIYTNWQSSGILAYRVEDGERLLAVVQNIRGGETVCRKDYEWRTDRAPRLGKWAQAYDSGCECRVEGDNIFLPPLSVAVIELV